MMRQILESGLISAGLVSATLGFAQDRALRAELDVHAPVAEVWKAWTTCAGAQSFFAPACRIEPRVDGAYEVYFLPGAPAGERGSEGMRILAFEPMRRLAFTWSAPPTLPAIRAQRNMVVVELEPVDATRTRVRFSHIGWGAGPEWDRAYDYFDHAWNAVVLPRLKYRFEHGPIDWSAPPKLEPVAPTMKTPADK
jgi:uncharacterized protein YndB with AHSA1/START domain